jgi:hypothetical protein
MYERPPPVPGSDLAGFFLCRKFDHAIYLNEVMRQRNPETVARNNRFRDGKTTEEDAAFFNAHSIPNLPAEKRTLFEEGSTADGSVRMTTICETYEQVIAAARLASNCLVCLLTMSVLRVHTGRRST